VKQDELQAEADRLVAQGASGQEFEMLHRRGWKPKSSLAGSGLTGCPSDCGVCFPVFTQRRRGR
jgi:hypothetical protein